MGSGSSSGKVQNINKGTQMPSVSQPRPPSSPSRLDEPVFKPISSKPKVHNHRRSAPDDEFTLDSNIEEYSSIWDPTTRVKIFIL